jgi:hypothetical protein
MSAIPSLLKPLADISRQHHHGQQISDAQVGIVQGDHEGTREISLDPFDPASAVGAPT